MGPLEKVRPGQIFRAEIWNKMVDEVNRLAKLEVVEPLALDDDPANPILKLGDVNADDPIWIRLEDLNDAATGKYDVTIVRPDPGDPTGWTDWSTDVAWEANENSTVPVAPASAYYPAWREGSYLRFYASACS